MFGRHFQALLGAVIFAASGLLSAQAIVVGGGRFDLMMASANVVAKVRVERMVEAPSEMIGFSGTVLSVLKTDGEPVPEELVLEAATPIWPDDLGLEFAEGKTVLLVLNRHEGVLHVDWNMRAILPALSDSIPNAENVPPARKVFLELRAFLETVGDGRTQARILALLGALGDAGDLEFFGGLAESADPWVRRSARAAAARIDPRPERIQFLVEDFMVHLADLEATGSEEDRVVWEIYDDVYWASRCGDFGREVALASRAKAYLSVYRVLVDRAPPGYGRISIGIEGLRNVGTGDDLPRLARFLDHETDWMRHDVLEGMGRILGLPCKRPPIPSYGRPLPPEVAAWEQRTRAELEKRMSKGDRLPEP